MGRLENFKQRGRNRATKKRNPFVVIACEGNNKTEEVYFKNFNSRKCIIRFSTGNSTDPVGIVNDLLKFIDNDIGRELNDKYFVVLDTDVNQNKQNKIDEAKRIASENGVEFITSTPAFEFWYMLHFGFTTKTYNLSEEVQADVRNKISGYTKSMNTYPIIKEHTKLAIKNAKNVEKHHLELGQALDNEKCNPYTGAYKIVEELIERNK